MNLISWLMLMVLVLLSVAFVTLFERKILALVQTRIGPNKVFFYGLIQPVLDGFKLFFKMQLGLESMHKILYKMVSVFTLVMMFLLLSVLPFNILPSVEYQVFWFLIVFGVNSHLLLISGWASQSKYSMIGSVRSLSQSISYEILLTLVIFLPFYLNFSMSWDEFFSSSVMLMFWIWIMTMLMENQRAPFDLAESESELVSGLNTEFGSIFFVYFFLAEYGNLLLISFISNMVWFGCSWIVFFWVFLWLIIRACFPRVRFDQIMSLTWMISLPSVIFMWIFFLNSSVL